jgi:membrane protein DedA with SNARE-associated domain
MDLSFEAILRFVETHHGWGALIFGLLAFGESLVVVGVLIPGTTVMLAVGPLVGAGLIPFWEVYVGGVIGGFLGDAVSFAIGRRFGPAAKGWLTARGRQQAVERAEAAFVRFGWIAVFAGRFIGPLRASIPFTAGMLAMPALPFQAINIASAVIWVPVLIGPGMAATKAYQLAQAGRVAEAVFGVVLLLLLVVSAIWLARRYGAKLGAMPRPVPSSLGERDPRAKGE